MKPDHIPFRKFPADIFFMSGIPLVITALCTSAIMEHTSVFIILALFVALLGATLLFISKLPLYRSGRFFTVGSGDLPASHVRLYRWGIILSVAGSGIAALLIPLLYLFHK